MWAATGKAHRGLFLALHESACQRPHHPATPALPSTAARCQRAWLRGGTHELLPGFNDSAWPHTHRNTPKAVTLSASPFTPHTPPLQLQAPQRARRTEWWPPYSSSSVLVITCNYLSTGEQSRPPGQHPAPTLPFLPNFLFPQLKICDTPGLCSTLVKKALVSDAGTTAPSHHLAPSSSLGHVSSRR